MSDINSLIEARVTELQSIINDLNAVEQNLKAARAELDTCKKLLFLRKEEPQESSEPEEDVSTHESSQARKEEIKDPSRLIFDRISLDGDLEAFDYAN